MMLWKYVKNLSERSELWDLGWTYFVKKRKTDNLVDFYSNSDFKNRVNTFLDKESTNIWYVFEKWEELELKDKQSIKRLAVVLSKLYNEVSDTVSVDDYIEKEYSKRIERLRICELPQDYQDTINKYFLKFKSIVWKEPVNLSRIHWDLKPDNVIVKWKKLTIIDWEWCKKWSYVEDVQRFVYWLDENEKKCFIEEVEKNLMYKENNFRILYLFHEFLLLILWLSKDKIDLSEFVSILERDGVSNL